MLNRRKPFRKIYFIVWSLFFAVAGFTGALLLYPVAESQAQTSAVLPGAPGSFAELVKKVSPSVVNISTVKVIKGRGRSPHQFGPNDPFRDFFDRYFRDQMPKDFRQRSLGTGFIIDKDGLILTNNHVVEGTDEIKVTLADKKDFKAEVVGRDSKTDLALIRIKSDSPLVPLPLGDSSKIQVGDWVIAIGNPFGLGNTVTAGIVSAKYRQIGAGSYDNFIQTDASINPGNSGGPLLNTAGEVIGINTVIFTQSGGSEGIGFAIPVNMAKTLLPQLKKGKVIRGWLGVMIQTITPELKDKLGLENENGALVADVSPGGPADKAGIERGDVIVSFDGKDVKEMKDLPYMVAETPVGKRVQVDVIRKGEKKSVSVEIGQLEEGKESQAVTQAEPNLGMTVEEITPEIAKRFNLSDSTGLVVVEVEGNSPAEEAGLRAGDMILEIDQVAVKTLEEYQKKIQDYKKGDTVLVLIKRGGATLYLTMKIQE